MLMIIVYIGVDIAQSNNINNYIYCNFNLSQIFNGLLRMVVLVRGDACVSPLFLNV